jgi:hypothetical protein
MRKSDLLFLTTALLTVWNAAVIWMTQVICYPLWPRVGAAEFQQYHLAWWHLVWWTFIPAGLALLGSLALLRARPEYLPQGAVVLVLVAQLITLGVTLIFWAPLQARLATPTGLDLVGFHALMWTHWFRVALLWLAAGVMVATLGRRVITAS